MTGLACAALVTGVCTGIYGGIVIVALWRIGRPNR